MFIEAQLLLYRYVILKFDVWLKISKLSFLIHTNLQENIVYCAM